MKVTGVVHSCTEQELPVVAEYNGQPIAATVTGLVIEIVGGSRSWTFDHIPASPEDMEAQKAIFTVGATVTTNDFALVEG